MEVAETTVRGSPGINPKVRNRRIGKNQVKKLVLGPLDLEAFATAFRGQNSMGH